MDFSRPSFCRGPLPLEIIVLLLKFVPYSSAQSNTNPPSQTPTTLQTSLSPSPTPPPAASTPTVTTNDDDNNDDVSDHVFNYYFLIIAAVAIVVAIIAMSIKSQKRRKRALLRSRSQRALARDVEGFRQRFGIGRTGVLFHGTHTRTRSAAVEGLDDRGEAPPPYVPGSKPPSIRSTDGVIPLAGDLNGQSLRENGNVEVVEMQNIGGIPTTEPPGYNDHPVAEQDAAGNHNGERHRFDILDGGNLRPSMASGHEIHGTTGNAFDNANTEITRPATAVTASAGFSSTRRILSNISDEGSPA
jgi:hypothetical protein